MPPAVGRTAELLLPRSSITLQECPATACSDIRIQDHSFDPTTIRARKLGTASWHDSMEYRGTVALLSTWLYRIGQSYFRTLRPHRPEKAGVGGSIPSLGIFPSIIWQAKKEGFKDHFPECALFVQISTLNRVYLVKRRDLFAENSRALAGRRPLRSSCLIFCAKPSGRHFKRGFQSLAGADTEHPTIRPPPA